MLKGTLICAALLSVTACMDDGIDSTASEAASGDEAEAGVPTRAHLFLLDAKSYIAPIPAAMIGSFAPFDPIQELKLKALAGATNLAYSENPQTGAQNANQFRVWTHLGLDVLCIGSIAKVKLFERANDVGLEGPFRGVLDPIQSSVTDTGAFSFIGAAGPNPAVEPTFQIIRPRASSKIWYKVKGHVFCNPNAEAFVVLDSVSQTNFPSVRVWATRVTGGVILPEGLLYTYNQGKMTGLWSLEPKPAL